MLENENVMKELSLCQLKFYILNEVSKQLILQ